MKLSSLLSPSYISVQCSVKTKKEAIDTVLTSFKKHYKFDIDYDYVEKTIEEREKLGGTTFESGIAIPHARLDNFDDLLIGILIPSDPFYDNNIEVKAVVLILTSKTVSSVYLNTLASFIKISREKEFFQEIISSRSGDELIDLAEKKNLKVKEELTVESIMSENVIFITPDSTVKEIADSFYKNKTGYLPVLDENGNFTGEINLLMLIKEGIPDYATQLGKLGFLKSFEPLERLFRKEDEIKASEIMKKPSIVFEKDTSIIEAALEFVKSNRRHIPVVENGKVIGILALADILNKILRS